MIPLKEAVQEKHMNVTYLPFNQRMVKGCLTKKEYLLYLIQQKEIFKAIEENNILPSPYLYRAELVQKDIAGLIAEENNMLKVLDSSQKYSRYLRMLTADEKRPHIYMNYLALVYGGQMTKKVVPATTFMYEFENMPEAIQSIRRIQKDEWAAEVNKGFDFLISIFDELEMENLKCNEQQNG